jgi:predicted permease
MRKQPAFALSVIGSLALAIGASAVAFSILDAVRLRAIPLPDSDRLVLISEVPIDRDASSTAATGCRNGCSVSYATYSQVLAVREFTSVGSLAAFTAGGKALTIGNDTQTVIGTVCSESLFTMLGVRPVLGRLFTADDNRLGTAPVTLLSHGLWVSQFAQDPGVIGRPIQLSDTRYTVVGVMPAGFDFELGSQFWLPDVPTLDPSTRPSITSVAVIARLAPDTTLEQFRAELASVDLTAVRRPPGSGRRFALGAEPLRARYVAATQGHDVLFLVIVGCVLVIACANVTNLLLARAIGERRAFSIRTALGAGASQLVRLVLAEHFVFVTAGAALGLLIAWLALPVVGSADQLNSLRLTDMSYRLDFRVAGFAIGVAVLVAVAISIVPLLMVMKGDVQVVLREHGEGAADGRRGALAQRAFVVAQLACAVALVVGGGLATRRVWHLSHLNLGFDAAHIVQSTPSLPHDWRVKDKFVPLIERILDDLRAVPGAVSVGARAFVPLGNSATLMPSTSAQALPPGLVPGAMVAVNPEYFETLGIRILRGRAFSRADRELSAPVAIVNQWAADRWWNGKDPLGETIRVTAAENTTTTLTVVGVVADNKAGQSSLLLADDGPLLYRPLDQAPSAFASFFVRAAGDPSPLVRPINQTVARLVPNRPLSTQAVRTVIDQQLGGLRSTAAQLTGTAGAGLFLALIGVHGVLVYNVNRRTRELGIRRVLGATTGSVLKLVLSDAGRLAVLGVMLGLGVAWAGLRWMGPVATDGGSAEIGVYASAAMFALLAALASALIPARRASRVSPQEAIRGQN